MNDWNACVTRTTLSLSHGSYERPWQLFCVQRELLWSHLLQVPSALKSSVHFNGMSTSLTSQSTVLTDGVI